MGMQVWGHGGVFYPGTLPELPCAPARRVAGCREMRLKIRRLCSRPSTSPHVALEARRLCAELAQCHADTGAEPGLDPANLCDALQQGLAALDALGSCVQWPSPMPGQPHYLNVAAGPPADRRPRSRYPGQRVHRPAGPALRRWPGACACPSTPRQVEALALPLGLLDGPARRRAGPPSPGCERSGGPWPTAPRRLTNWRPSMGS